MEFQYCQVDYALEAAAVDSARQIFELVSHKANNDTYVLLGEQWEIGNMELDGSTLKLIIDGKCHFFGKFSVLYLLQLLPSELADDLNYQSGEYFLSLNIAPMFSYTPFF